MLALAHYRSSKCPCGCGHSMADTTSQEEGGPQFVASRVTCRARLALLEAQRGAAEDSGTDNAPARLWQVEKR